MASALTERARLPGRPFAGGAGLTIGSRSIGSHPGRVLLQNHQRLPVGAPAGSPDRPAAKGNQPGTNSVPARFATGGSSGTPAKRPNPPQAVGAPAPGAKGQRRSQMPTDQTLMKCSR